MADILSLLFSREVLTVYRIAVPPGEAELNPYLEIEFGKAPGSSRKGVSGKVAFSGNRDFPVHKVVLLCQKSMGLVRQVAF